MARRGRLALIDESIFFVTTTVVRFTKIFTVDKYCEILVHNIKHYQKRYKLTILAYVIMPTHFHWIVIVDKNEGTISDIMRDIKKYSAWDILEQVEKDNRLDLIKRFKSEGEGLKNHKRKFWMKRFDDEVIRNVKMFWIKRNYIHNNPVKAGIVCKPEDYKYSSAKNYIFDDHSVLLVDTEYGGIEIK